MGSQAVGIQKNVTTTDRVKPSLDAPGGAQKGWRALSDQPYHRRHLWYTLAEHSYEYSEQACLMSKKGEVVVLPSWGFMLASAV